MSDWRAVVVEYVDYDGETTYEHLGPYRGVATASRVADQLRTAWAAIDPNNGNFYVTVSVRLFAPLPDVLTELRRCADFYDGDDAPH